MDLIEKFEVDLFAALPKLEWKLAEDMAAVPGHVEFAVRFGVPTSDGIVVDGQYAAAVYSLEMLKKTHEQAKISHQHPAILSADRLLEQLSPGWMERGAQLDASIDEGYRKEVARRVSEIRTFLNAPVKPELAEHWSALGGLQA
ncbi:hypothetical protein [Tsukamurella tyrosinosolvens]|uniref:hypothetical protein n=1 Tax=Tsukamurella tyrosinosolvens TaxID=57704 RepID=UPI0034636810